MALFRGYIVEKGKSLAGAQFTVVRGPFVLTASGGYASVAVQTGVAARYDDIGIRMSPGKPTAVIITPGDYRLEEVDAYYVYAREIDPEGVYPNLLTHVNVNESSFFGSGGAVKRPI